MAESPRHIIIGDVHGNWQGVVALLEKAAYEPGRDKVVFAGDYNDCYAYEHYSVRKLIDVLLELHDSAPGRTFFVRGNHDLWFSEWLQTGGVPSQVWYIQGGKETLRSYGIIDDLASQDQRAKVPTAHQEFIINIVRQYYLDDRVVVIHGGFRSEGQMRTVAAGRQLNNHDLEEIIWDRHFMFIDDEAVHENYAKYFGKRYLITGHTPQGPYVNPRNPKWILINSARWGEILSAVVISDERNYSIIHASCGI